MFFRQHNRQIGQAHRAGVAASPKAAGRRSEQRVKWSEICIHTTEEAVDAVANMLYEAGAGGVAIEDAADLLNEHAGSFGEMYALNPEDYPKTGVNVKAYLPADRPLEAIIEKIRQSIGYLPDFGINPGDAQITVRGRREEEWADAWKHYYRPSAIGKRLTVAPAWSAYRPKTPDEKVIELDPGMAFGTGTHPTTLLCVEALEAYMPEGADVLDVGTGTGILAIAAAKLGAADVLAVDLDPVAVRSAAHNVKLNHVQDKVRIRQNNLANDLAPGYDVIVANLLADLVIRLVEDGASGLLSEDGFLIASGIIGSKENEVADSLSAHGFRVAGRRTMGDWVALIAGKES